jgi:HK97 family phage portal protein
MGLINKMAQRFKLALKGRDPLDDFAWALSEYSGTHVTGKTALRVMAVLGCVRVISEDIGKLPFKLYQNYDPLDERKRRVAREHPLHRILSSRPNEWMTSQEFRESTTALAALWGGGYAIKRQSVVDSEIYELLPLQPSQVQVRQNPDYSIEYQVTTQNGAQRTFSRRDMFHIKALSFDFVDGARVYDLARTTIELALATERYQANLAKHGVRPPGMLSTDLTLKQEQLEDARKNWREVYGGPEGAKSMPILHGGLKFVPMSMTGRDAEIIATREFEVIDICRAFRVHPNKLYAMKQAQTYASAEQFGIEYVEDTILPWAVRWEQTTERDLLSARDDQEGYFPKLMLQGLLRGDTAARGEYYSKAVGGPWLSPNEARVHEDYDPLDGLDKVARPLNMTTDSSSVSENGD